MEESMLGKIRLGEPVRVMISALGDQEWTGRVGEIQPAADPASRSSLVKIDLPENAGKKVPSGFSVPDSSEKFVSSSGKDLPFPQGDPPAGATFPGFCGRPKGWL